MLLKIFQYYQYTLLYLSAMCKGHKEIKKWKLTNEIVLAKEKFIANQPLCQNAAEEMGQFWIKRTK